jgi:hypothetical protein
MSWSRDGGFWRYGYEYCPHPLCTCLTISQSIDLTRLPIPANPSGKSTDSTNNTPAYEYSSREVSPSALLLQQLIQAHGVFLLHNGVALGHIFDKLNRSKFCSLLDRFWNRFAQNWNVLLHGNPAVDIFGGLKLSAGGELGIGVGEEEWGSGEREVLEDFAGRTDGLVDLVVSRFGEPSASQMAAPRQPGSGNSKQMQETARSPWMGATHYAEAVDGIFFSGVGAISRSSLRDISHWTEWIYAYGDHAYGVKDNTSSDRRKRKKRTPVASRDEDSKIKPNKTSATADIAPTARVMTPPGIPPPIVSAVERSLARATSANDIKKTAHPPHERGQSAVADSAVWVKYLTLGYGSAWGGSDHAHATLKREGSSTADDEGEEQVTPQQERSMQHLYPEPDVDHEAELEERLKSQIQLEENGNFIIGLKGDLEGDDDPDDEDEEGSGELHQRILLRTLHVELVKKPPTDGEDDDESPAPSPYYSTARVPQGKQLTRLRVVVYVHRPFIYTFLFRPQASNISLPAFYRNLHTFFAPLHRPLSASTSPSRVAERIASASRPYTTSPPQQPQPSGGEIEQTVQPIFDIVYDPRSLSVHASIPNIPTPGTYAAEGLRSLNSNVPEGWSRAEALNVHSAILEIWRNTRPETSAPGLRELERSVKTARGWWVVWMRLDDESERKEEKDKNDDETSTIRSNSQNTERGDYFNQSTTSSHNTPAKHIDDGREAILVRRARDAIPEAKSKARATSGLWGFGGAGFGSSGKDTGSGWGPARLAEGVGVDARRYVEGLLSLNR